MKKELIIILFIILLTNLSIAENNMSEVDENAKKYIYYQTAYICCPYNLTAQNSLAECFTYSIYGTDDEENKIKWLKEGISYHIIFKNETYDLGNRTITLEEFDEVGERIKKTDYNINSNGDNRTTYYVDESFIQIRITNGTIINESYYYVNGKLLVMEDNDNNMFYYHPDHLGSTSLVTNQTQNIVEEEFYLPYGDSLEGNEESRFLYNSKEKDRDTDLYYYGARYYSPFVGQFTQADTIISEVYNPQNLNLYSYTLNNPYKYTDPTGNTVDPISQILIYSTLFGAGENLLTSIVYGESPEKVITNTIGGAAGGFTQGLVIVGGITILKDQAFTPVGREAIVIAAATEGYTVEQGVINFIEGRSLKDENPVDIIKGIIGGYAESKGIPIPEKEKANKKETSELEVENSKLLKTSQSSYPYTQHYSGPYGRAEDPGIDGVIYGYGSRSKNKLNIEATKQQDDEKTSQTFI